jgi:hypothetical protein
VNVEVQLDGHQPHQAQSHTRHLQQQHTAAAAAVSSEHQQQQQQQFSNKPLQLFAINKHASSTPLYC